MIYVVNYYKFYNLNCFLVFLQYIYQDQILIFEILKQPEV